MNKILIISSNAKSLILFRYELMEALIKQGCEVVALTDQSQITPEIIKKLECIGVQVMGYRINNTGINFFADVKTLWYLYSIIKKNKPNTILSYTIKPVIYGSIAAWCARVSNRFAMVTGLGTAFTNIHSKRKRVIYKIVKQLYRFALKLNQKIFFQNPDDLAEFVNLGLTHSEKTVLINGSGVNLEVFFPQALPSKLSFLFIGRIVVDKGVSEFIYAAEQVKQKYSDIRFVVIGPRYNHVGNKQTVLSTLLESKAVEYIGEVDDVKPHLSACSVFVLPSYREGTPRSVLEAMAIARPIITTDAPGCRETVIDTVTGFLVPVGNVDLLVEKMEYFIQNPEACIRMGQAGRQLVEKKYDVKKVNEVIIKTILGKTNNA